MKSRGAKLVLAGAVATVAGLVGSNALAQNIATVEGLASGTTASLNSDPVITAILSQPGTTDGKSYSNWSFLVNDGTGSLDIFGSGTSLTSLGFTPVVGQTISVSGTYSPYDSIPELGTLTAISGTGTAAVPGIGTSTVATLNQSTIPNNIAGYLWTVDNATISGITTASTFGIANLTGSISDSSGSMTLYYWATSYSMAVQNLYGSTIPTGPVDVTGFVDQFSGTDEFIPISITAVPEPTTLALAGIGGLSMLFLRRRSL